MAVLPIEDLNDGMVVQVDVTNLHGQVLFRSGTVLTAKLIERLEAWGVFEIDVELDEIDQAREDEINRLIESKMPEIEQRFRWSDVNDSTVKELVRLTAERMVRAPASNKG